MAKRTIQYGYKLENGKIAIDYGEAEIVREIFRLYIENSSLKKVADELNRREVVYFKGKIEWGKHRVALIIENKRYMDNSLQTPEKNLYKCYNIYKKSEEVRYTLWFIFVKQ